MAEYIIHTCLDREWYVREYLIPDMVSQGIDENNIEVWLDKDRDGCLLSCMKCFQYCGTKGGGRWHLQDDALISSDFREQTEKHDDGIVTGFMRREWQMLTPTAGRVPAVYMWNSFLCLRIPDDIAGECAKWFFTDAAYRENYKHFIEHNNGDDSLFFDFFVERHTEDWVYNISPNIVEHIDFLIGGSVTNKWRKAEARSDLWDDHEAYNRMKDKLASR
jgi:hypothetical protein